MKQVTQTMGKGEILVQDTPLPTLNDKFVLVKNSASVISAGTEKSKVDMGKMNLLQKAQARPDQVKQVLNKLKTEGFKKTLNTVKSRLSDPEPLGYSCSGEVVATGGLVEGLKPGDRVACGGAGYANHAEFVAVPKNLVVKIPSGVSNEEAAFTTVGAIAMQGLRLAEPMLGETYLVLGLGLIGQIMVQLLRANGCQVIATDLDPDLVKRAEEKGAIGATHETESVCKAVNGGQGVDGVLVCAGTSSNQPIELCGQVTREKGKVVVVGAIKMDIPREDYFKKEISVVISRSYGPGRYDPFYEENGNDYPLGYVRFTEQRNMQAFLDLIADKKVNVKELVSHRFDVEEAAQAYDLIEGERKEPYLGILLSYSKADSDTTDSAIPRSGKKVSGKFGVSFFGAGNYATASLLPVLKGFDALSFKGIATATGRSATNNSRQFGFEYCTDNVQDLLRDDTQAVMITTRHDTHSRAVVTACQSDKHVYVEKPLALSVDELIDVKRSYTEHPDSTLMVGFNRRFAPATQSVLRHLESVKQPRMINIRVNAGVIEASHWIQDPEVGGGRIIGEACHFVDLAACLADSPVTQVSSSAILGSQVSAKLADNVAITLEFENGSVANIVYSSQGSRGIAKERIEVFCAGKSALIDDFKQVTLFEPDGKKVQKSSSGQDKGQKAMLLAWIKAASTGQNCVPSEVLFNSSLATILAVESISLGCKMPVSSSILSTEG